MPSKLYHNYMNIYELRNMDDICNVPIISGCFSLLNLDLLKKYEIKGYDNRFFMYFEDFDLSRRFHKKSKTIYYPFVSTISQNSFRSFIGYCSLFFISSESYFLLMNNGGISKKLYTAQKKYFMKTQV